MDATTRLAIRWRSAFSERPNHKQGADYNTYRKCKQGKLSEFTPRYLHPFEGNEYQARAENVKAIREAVLMSGCSVGQHKSGCCA
jgi:hypothetical protein